MFTDALVQLRKSEAEQDLEVDWEIDAFMTADTVAGKREAIVSEYILRILGLEVRQQKAFARFVF